MAITVEWEGAERRTARLSFLGSWNWDELQHAIDVVETMSADCRTPVDMMIDLTSADTLPAGSLLDPAVRAQVRQLARRAAGYRGRVVVIGASPWIALLYGMFQGWLGPRTGGLAFGDRLPPADESGTGSPDPAPFGPSPAEAA